MASFDLLIHNGKVIDGTGLAGYRADIGVVGNKIVEIGNLSQACAQTKFNAQGMVVAPGFIDVHTHDDSALIYNPKMQMRLSQGVTTVITGCCGISLFPVTFDDYPVSPLDLLGDKAKFCYSSARFYFEDLKRQKPRVNSFHFVGHSSLRLRVMGDVMRPATAVEIKKMEYLIEEAMESGAIGLSFGLQYAPSKYATTAEAVALAKVVAKYDGICSIHLRDEFDEVIEALAEAFFIGKQANVPIFVSHHKVGGVNNYGKSELTLSMFEAAKKDQKVGLDVYPYCMGSTALLSDFVAASEKTFILWSKTYPQMAGAMLHDIQKKWQCEQAKAIKRLMPAGAIYWNVDEADLCRILSYPDTMIGSDGVPVGFDQDVAFASKEKVFSHPRLWGTFPRVLGYYSRKIKLFSLEEAVRKMTSLPAESYGLKNIGKIQKGFFADLVVLNPESIIDCARVEAPQLQSCGIKAVFVRGARVLL